MRTHRRSLKNLELNDGSIGITFLAFQRAVAGRSRWAKALRTPQRYPSHIHNLMRPPCIHGGARVFVLRYFAKTFDGHTDSPPPDTPHEHPAPGILERSVLDLCLIIYFNYRK
jgi:hypothetical protein